MRFGISDRSFARIARVAMPFLADPDVSEVYQGVQEFPGFHTTSSFEIACTYAVGRVSESFTEEDQDGIHYVTDYPVVVALEMDEYTPTTDYDAEEIVWDILEVHLGEVRSQLKYDGKDLQNLSDAEIFYAAEYIVEGGTDSESSTWDADDPSASLFGALFSYVQGNPLSSIVEDYRFPNAFRSWLASGEFDKDLLMIASQQFRYTEDVDESNILAVWYITPLSAEFRDYDMEEEFDEEAWAGFDTPEFGEITEDYSFVVNQVWGSGQKRNLELFSEPQYQSRDIEYHGTTYKRLLLAAPFLASQMPEPPNPPYRG